MSMPKPVPNAKANVRTTLDTVLLSTLVNKELGADGRVFTIKMEYIPSNQIWQVWVEHFKGTHTSVNPDHYPKYEDLAKLAKNLAATLLNSMTSKLAVEPVELKEPKKSGEKK